MFAILFGVIFALSPFVEAVYLKAAVAALALPMGCLLAGNRALPKPTVPALALLALALYAAWAIYSDPRLEHSWSNYLAAATDPLVMFAAACGWASTKDWRRMAWVYVGGCLVAALGLMSSLAVGDVFDETMRATVGAINPNVIAYSLVTAVPILSALLLGPGGSPRGRMRYVVGAMIVVLGAGVAVTGSRGAAAAYALCTALIIGRVYPKWTIVAVPVVIGAGWFLLPEELRDRLLMRDDQAALDVTTGRRDQLPAAEDLILSEPWWGNGYDSYRRYTGEEVTIHNVFLHVLCDYGAFGLALYLTAVGGVFWRLLASREGWRQWSGVLLVFSWPIIAMTGVWAHAIPAWFAFGWLYRTPRLKPPAAAKPTTPAAPAKQAVPPRPARRSVSLQAL